MYHTDAYFQFWDRIGAGLSGALKEPLLTRRSRQGETFESSSSFDRRNVSSFSYCSSGAFGDFKGTIVTATCLFKLRKTSPISHTCACSVSAEYLTYSLLCWSVRNCRLDSFAKHRTSFANSFSNGSYCFILVLELTSECRDLVLHIPTPSIYVPF